MSNVLQMPAAESRDCKHHGPYEARYFPSLVGGGSGHWYSECPQCVEARERERQECEHNLEVMGLLQKADIPPRFQGKGFSAFKPRTPKQSAALKVCRKYVNDLNENFKAGTCLVLLGPVGVGKSHLLSAILQEAVAALCRVRYTTAADFLATISGNWAWHGQDAGKPYVRVPLLALDEIGMPEGGRDREALFALIDARYRECRPTLLASNMKWQDMRESLGHRLYDRLRENGGQVVALDGESYRGQGAT